jgi:polysaccharide biosynthesis/export protein
MLVGKSEPRSRLSNSPAGIALTHSAKLPLSHNANRLSSYGAILLPIIALLVSLAQPALLPAQSSSGTGYSMPSPQVPSMSGQNPLSIPSTGQANSLGGSGGLSDGPIQAGDIVQIQVFDAPEMSVTALVSQTGDIPIPLLNTFHIAGLTSIQAAAALAKAFKENDLLENPNILVVVQQSGNGITVAGEVRAPGVYPMVGKHRLIDVLTRAGGPTDGAAHVIEVVGPKPDQIQRVIWDPTFQENPAIRVMLESNQTVLVGKCGIVYLGGNLNRPGAFPLCASRHTTLSEAITLAGGTRPSTASSKTVLMRNEQGTRTIRQVNLEDILRGKSPDFTLSSDDIVYVPSSALKASLKTMGQAALNFALAVSSYRLQ